MQRLCSEERWGLGAEEDMSFGQVDWSDELATGVENFDLSTTVCNEEEEEEEICVADEVANKNNEWDARTPDLSLQAYSWLPHSTWTAVHPVTPMAYKPMHPVMPMACQPLFPHYSSPQTPDLRHIARQGTKRLRSESSCVGDLSHVRPKSARKLKRQDQTAAVAAVHVPLPNLAMLEHVSSFPCYPRNVRPNHFPVRTTVLPCCKFTSKHSKEGCKRKPSIVKHKRGHLASAAC